MKKILVVVDMQNDFIDGPLGSPEARAIVDNVCAKIREGEWDWIIRTMDTHDDGYLDTQEGKKLPVKHCLHETDGWCSNEAVRNAIREAQNTSTNNDKSFRSSFIKKDTFGSHELSQQVYCRLLTTEWVDTRIEDIELTLIGVCTDICVISNALLFKTYLPEMKIVVDAACCAGTTPAKHRMALEVMKSCQVDVENMPEDWLFLSDMNEKTMTNVLVALGESEE